MVLIARQLEPECSTVYDLVRNAIYHYVRDHHYAPPKEFVQAITRGPLPTTRPYRARMFKIYKREPSTNNFEIEYARRMRRQFEEETAVGRLKWWLKDHRLC